MPDEPGRDLAVPDPDDLAGPGAGQLEEAPLEGEIVEEAPAPPRPVIVQVFQAVTVVVQAPPVRHAVAHPAAGVVIAWRRWRRGRMLAIEMGQVARAQGDHANALLWAQQAETERQQRHGRAVKTAETLAMLVKLAPVALAVAVLLMAVLNVLLFIGTHRPADLAWSFLFVAHAVQFTVAAFAVLAWVLAFGVPAALYAAFFRIGSRGGDLAPAWSLAAKPGEEDRGLVVTADGIVAGLQNLSIPKMDKAFKDGWQPAFHTTPVRDGEGYFSVFSTPMGVTAEMIADRVGVFARNLHRAQNEVWVTDAERDKIAPAGYVAVWVANPGVLDRDAPEWPLLHEGTADVFQGVPAGVSPRSDQMTVKIVANNLVCGGIMGVGKSNACRVVILGAALDPLAEIWVHVFAYNGDFDAFEPRLARYVKGAEEEQLAAALESLRELYAEVSAREARLSEIGALRVTRQIAQKYPELRPKLALFSECHELFGSRDFGEEATELAVRVMRRARKTAIWMGFDTQDARKDAIPPKIVSLVSVNICFAVKSWRANDGFLGDGSFQAGIRATELRANRDLGRSVTTGVSDAQFELLKWHYIFNDPDTGQDDARPVIERAMRAVDPQTPVSGSRPAAIVVRNLLDDLAEVIGGPDRVRLADLPARLRQLDKSYYRGLDGVQLAQMLDDEGVRWIRPKNVPQLDPAELNRVRAERGELAVPSPLIASRSPPRACRLTRLTGSTGLTTAGQGRSEAAAGAGWKANLPSRQLTREETRS